MLAPPPPPGCPFVTSVSVCPSLAGAPDHAGRRAPSAAAGSAGRRMPTLQRGASCRCAGRCSRVQDLDPVLHPPQPMCAVTSHDLQGVGPCLRPAPCAPRGLLRPRAAQGSRSTLQARAFAPHRPSRARILPTHTPGGSRTRFVTPLLLAPVFALTGRPVAMCAGFGAASSGRAGVEILSHGRHRGRRRCRCHRRRRRRHCRRHRAGLRHERGREGSGRKAGLVGRWGGVSYIFVASLGF